MPLKSGSSQSTISSNIEELHTGNTYSHTEGKFGKHRADKQAVAIALDVARRAKRASGGPVHVGPIIGDTGGRADKVNTDVPNGCYIVPSDIVSGIGEGNTLHGMKIIEHMFPHPHGPGATSNADPVPVAVAHGEISISPEQLEAKFGGDLEHAHAAMDHWVKLERKKIIKTLQKLPGPAKD